MVSIENVGVSFNGNFLYRGVNFQIKNGDRVGLIGKNGAGKSTLLKCIAGFQSYDEGNIVMPKNLRMGYLKQDLGEQGEGSVLEEAMLAYEETDLISKQLDDLSVLISTREDYESEDYANLIQKISDLGEQLSMMDADSQEGKAEKILIGLGFTREELSRKIRTFSGGWRMRVELAKILLQQPDLLLLDEPTNHLDIVSIQWLERYLKNYSGIIVLISHDQEFLDQVTNRTVELVNQSSMDMPLPYSKYLEQKSVQIDLLKASKENQDKKIEEMERFIERFRSKATKAKQVQSRIKLLDKVDRIIVDEEVLRTMKIRFPEPPRAGKQIVTIENISKHFEEKEVLNNIDVIIGREEKIAFLGKNGEGKSTLLKMIVGELEPTAGKMELGHNVNMGYYAQNQAEELDLNKTVFATIDDIAKGDIRKRVRDLLGAFLFSGEDVEKQVKVLSGGEKARLALCKLLLEPYNFLVLDEPTNHLDIQSKEILKDALANYQGSMVIVSHDRAFLRGLSNKIFEVKNKKIREFVGDIDYYVSQTTQTENDSLKSENPTPKVVKPVVEVKKRPDNEIKQLKNKVNKLEKEIEEIEIEIKNLENLLSMPENATNFNLFNQHSDFTKKLNQLTKEWEQCIENLEG